MTNQTQKFSLEEYFVTQNNLNIELVESGFTQKEFDFETHAIVSIKGKWEDVDLHKKCNIILEIILDGTKDINPHLKFMGNFTIEGYERIEPSKMSVKLVKYCREIIGDYIKEKPLTDENNNLFFNPPIYCSDIDFQKLIFL